MRAPIAVNGTLHTNPIRGQNKEVILVKENDNYMGVDDKIKEAVTGAINWEERSIDWIKILTVFKRILHDEESRSIKELKENLKIRWNLKI